MAVCLLSKDILQSTVCSYSLKQVTELYIANYSDVQKVEVGAPTEGTGVEVKTITMVSQKQFYKVEPNKNSATYNDDLMMGDGGSKYRSSNITWNIGGKYDASMVDVLDALSLGKFIIVAKLSDGSYIMFGRLTPMEANAASLQSAAEATGFNGITVTFNNNTNESPIPLSEEAITTVTTPAIGG